MGSLTASQIPVIDLMDDNLNPGTATWFSVSQIVRGALETNGCFYVKSDKVPMELCNSVFALAKELFDLPLETKKQKISDKPNHGYVGGIPRVPLYEAFGIDLDSIISNEEAIQKFANIMWPKGYDHFCETINLYAKLLVEMDHTAKRLLFDAYGLDKCCYDSLIESTNYLFRGFKYLVPQKTESNVGLIPHTDSTYFTILHQSLPGLEVKLQSGEWVNIDLSPSVFLIVAGDALKVWSNDRIAACVHKVMMREEKERYSIGLSSFNSKMVETQEELIDEDHPKRYRAFDNYEYIALRGKAPSQAEISNFILL